MPKRDAMTPRRLKLIRHLGQKPYSAAEELKRWPDTAYTTIGEDLKWLVRKRYAKRKKLGWMRDAQTRFALVDNGMDIYREQQHELAAERTTELDPDEVLNWGPMLECAYHAAPWAWSVHTVERAPKINRENEEITMPLNCPAVDFIWIPQGPVHAVVNHIDSRRTRKFSVPLVFFGPHVPDDVLYLSPDDLFNGMTTWSDTLFHEPAAPPGVVILAADPLAALRVRREAMPDVPKAIICYGMFASPKRRFGVVSVDKMTRPTYPMGEVVGPAPHLEYGIRRKTPSFLWNRTRYRVWQEIVESTGIRLSHLAKQCGLPKSQTTTMVNDLESERLTVQIGAALYVKSASRSLLAEHSRSDYNSVTARLGRTPTRPPNRQEIRRAGALSDLKLKAKDAGMFAWDGRRAGVGDPDGDQWYPDLWIGIRDPLESSAPRLQDMGNQQQDVPWPEVPEAEVPFLFFPLLFEPSARALRTVADVLRPLRPVLRGENGIWVALVVCGHDEAIQQFIEIGNDLNLLVTTYRQWADSTTPLNDVNLFVRHTKTRRPVPVRFGDLIAHAPKMWLNWSS